MFEEKPIGYDENIIKINEKYVVNVKACSIQDSSSQPKEKKLPVLIFETDLKGFDHELDLKIKRLLYNNNLKFRMFYDCKKDAQKIFYLKFFDEDDLTKAYFILPSDIYF